jgi:hypothetical protein
VVKTAQAQLLVLELLIKALRWNRKRRLYDWSLCWRFRWRCGCKWLVDPANSTTMLLVEHGVAVSITGSSVNYGGGGGGSINDGTSVTGGAGW